ncbi:TetR/AcrR family transcriptional regulator [Agrococcus jejuensis]|uniref:TetR/AcrR family transcriptional regulator n=1 Tax=Agrococcus jejuensis TaxID=399736 RepID=UPI0011A092C0|nr:TetR/AcrR family transcriptional regulator [Agrococcus jejuensis]
MPSASTPRSVNPRGEGARLRDEILRATDALLVDRAAEQVTLRAIARQAGITAPAIYRHFADRDAIVRAVVDVAFADLRAALEAGRASRDEPLGRLRGACDAYLAFAAEHPQQYRLMLGGVWDAAAAMREGDPTGLRELGLDAFQVVVDAVQECIDAGASSRADARAAAASLWAGLHGLAELRRTATLFPWPDDVARDLVDRLAAVAGD